MVASYFQHDIFVVGINQLYPLRLENTRIETLYIINYVANVVVANDGGKVPIVHSESLCGFIVKH